MSVAAENTIKQSELQDHIDFLCTRFPLQRRRESRGAGKSSQPLREIRDRSSDTRHKTGYDGTAWRIGHCRQWSISSDEVHKQITSPSQSELPVQNAGRSIPREQSCYSAAHWNSRHSPGWKPMSFLPHCRRRRLCLWKSSGS